MLLPYVLDPYHNAFREQKALGFLLVPGIKLRTLHFPYLLRSGACQLCNTTVILPKEKRPLNTKFSIHNEVIRKSYSVFRIQNSLPFTWQS